jgi:D-cysteine desulfhydrase
VKRDDLTGLHWSGNKVRKLEYCLSEAGRINADTIITCGGIQSNHCRTLAACCRALGLHPFLVLRGSPEKPYEGNLLLNYLFRAEIKYITKQEYENVNMIMEQEAEKLKKAGLKPYVIPEGASNEIGAFGYVECMSEMKKIIEKENIEAVYAAVGSGGTYAGLLLGKYIHGVDVKIEGVIVCDSIPYFREKILKICSEAVRKFDLKIEIKPDDVNLVDGYTGQGYGIPYPEEMDVIKRLAAQGLLLEPVYTGKAFLGMLEQAGKKYRKVLFIHTGGIFSIFAYKDFF